MNAQIEQVAKQVFYGDCLHLTDDGFDAHVNVGPEEDGLEVCINCGHPKCTLFPDESNIDLAEVKGRI